MRGVCRRFGAAAVGMHTIVHTSADETRTRLVTLIPDLAVSTRRDDVPNEGARP